MTVAVSGCSKVSSLDFLGFSSSPNKMPQGFRLSTRSKIIFKTAITGMERNMPEIPQSISPRTTPNTVMRGLILTLDPTIIGNNMLLSSRWVKISTISTSNTLAVTAAVAKVITVLITMAVNMPK